MNSTIVSKKKLLFVIPSLGGAGAERVVVHLINHLDKSRYDILLVIFVRILDYRQDLDSSTKIECLDKKSRWDFLKLVFRLRKVMRSFSPDVVISFLDYTNIITGIASLLFIRKKFRLILSERNHPAKYLPISPFPVLRKLLMRLTYKKADIMVAVSKSIGTVLEEDFNIQPERIACICNPVLVETIRSKSQNGAEHPFFRDENAQIIIGAGRLEGQKRFDRLLRAFSAIKRKHENARLIILGKGKLRKELEDLASQLNISKWVDFAGYKSNPYVWMAKADVFVLSSDYEGLPNVILEAMACGTPVVSTDCPSGPNEIITNGKNGILVPVSDEDALAQAISTLLKDRDLRRRFSEEGKKRAEDFTVEKIIPQYEELFGDENGLN